MSHLVPNHKCYDVHYKIWEALLGFRDDGTQRDKPNLGSWFFDQLPKDCVINHNHALALTNLLCAGCRIEEVFVEYCSINKWHKVNEVHLWGLGFERMVLANCFLLLKHCTYPVSLFYTDYQDWMRDWNRVAFAPDVSSLRVGLRNV